MNGPLYTTEILRLAASLDEPQQLERVDTVADSWHQPDHGIWEIRGDRHHYVHSKVMSWSALACTYTTWAV